MRSPSLPTTPRKPRRPAIDPVSGAERDNPAHLNFSFDDWFKANTELARLATGWTPADRLHADYVEYCRAADVPGCYVLALAAWDARMRIACGRLAEVRKIADGSRVSYARCYPRFLRRPIRVS